MEKFLKEKFRFIYDIRFIALILGAIYIACIMYSLRKTIIVNIDGDVKAITTFSQKYSSALHDNNIEIGDKDKKSVNLDRIIKDGQQIYIKKAVKVNIAVDGKTLNILSAEDNVEKMLEAEGIELSKEDIIEPSMITNIKEDMNIKITRVETKIIEEKQEIQFSKEFKKSGEYKKGTSKVIQSGENGEKLIKYQVVYKDSIEVSREKVSEEIVKDPVKEIIIEGTMEVLKTFGGKELAYSKKLRVKSTAYTTDYNRDGKPDNPYKNRTATGTIARRNKNGYSTIAVDPRIISLGTKVYVEGYGLAIAEDTGSAVKGNKIDVFVNSYYEAMRWGIKTLNIYILK
jgi:uncharacterized protein YabE (DUF348 family)